MNADVIEALRQAGVCLLEAAEFMEEALDHSESGESLTVAPRRSEPDQGMKRECSHSWYLVDSINGYWLCKHCKITGQMTLGHHEVEGKV